METKDKINEFLIAARLKIGEISERIKNNARFGKDVQKWVMDITDLRLFIMAVESPYNDWSELDMLKRIDFVSSRFNLYKPVNYDIDWLARFRPVKTLLKEPEITMENIYKEVSAKNLIYRPQENANWDSGELYINEALDLMMGKITMESDFLRYKVTNQDILNLPDQEIEIISHPPQGYITQVSELFVVLNAGTTPFNDTVLRLFFENQGDILHIFDLNSTKNQYFIAVPGVGFSALKLSVLQGEENPVNGTGTLDIYYKYRYVKLASDNIPI